MGERLFIKNSKTPSYKVMDLRQVATWRRDQDAKDDFNNSRRSSERWKSWDTEPETDPHPWLS